MIHAAYRGTPSAHAYFVSSAEGPRKPRWSALVRAVVKGNVSTAQSKEVYLKRYETMTQQYEAVTGDLQTKRNPPEIAPWWALVMGYFLF